ncbi:hypothetical protein LWI29_022726 [Acer saccharum]|uniref:Very-long-chain 3-oxoacyl-CoA synthase n=1 Tax=Acer saccharum TaxID=4024 RepID=A0AA39S494_ACESA|nr:hypothetical protein LWI29_022726 [Acer saccharum]
MFYLSKIYEYADTLLIIMSKSIKRLSFLHVYHHATVVIMCYVGLHTAQSSFPLVLVTNCLVHVFMYWYYLLCSLGLRPKWKRLVTDCQILQFMASFVMMAWMFYSHFTGSGCSGIWGSCFSAAFISTLLVLFVDFHSKSYSAKIKELEMLCSGLSISEKERPVGTLATNLKERGHQFKDCSDPGVGKEDTTEAMARLNVWLRTESPPKRFHQRNGPFDRRSWVRHGSNSYSRSDHGNWRPGAGLASAHKLSESSNTGNRLRNGGGQDSQAGKLHHLEPTETLMRNDSAINAINALKDNTLSEDKTPGVIFTTKKGKAKLPLKSANVKKKKGEQACPLMGQMVVDQNFVLGPSKDTGQTNSRQLDQALSMDSGIPTNDLIASSPLGPVNKAGFVTNKTHSSVNWKRAARATAGVSKLGVNSNLGKRENHESGEGNQSAEKKVKLTVAIIHSSIESDEIVNGNGSQDEALHSNS